MPKKRRFTADEKVMILREHLENNKAISELSEEYGVHPNLLYSWKKTMFEGAAETFSGKQKKRTTHAKPEEAKIKKLEETLRIRESLITDLAGELIELKKKEFGEDLTRNGWSRR